MTKISRELAFRIPLTDNKEEVNWTLRISIGGTNEILFELFWQDKLVPNHFASIDVSEFTELYEGLTKDD